MSGLRMDRSEDEVSLGRSRNPFRVTRYRKRGNLELSPKDSETLVLRRRRDTYCSWRDSSVDTEGLRRDQVRSEFRNLNGEVWGPNLGPETYVRPEKESLQLRDRIEHWTRVWIKESHLRLRG